MTNLQQTIIEEMKVKPSIDPQEEIRTSIDFMKNYLKSTHS
jgi:NAD+ synthase